MCGIGCLVYVGLDLYVCCGVGWTSGGRGCGVWGWVCGAFFGADVVSVCCVKEVGGGRREGNDCWDCFVIFDMILYYIDG
jgi:hypothetical protein